MDYPKRHPSLFFITLFAISLLFEISNGLGGVMRVQRKFMGNHRHLADLEKHDAHRHAQIIDVPIGGSTDMRIGLYFTELAIGTPPKNYTVHVDTGSSNLWINCQDCIGCPMDDDTQGIHLRPYNPSTSKTAKIVTRGHDYCKKRAPDSKDGRCPFDVHYLDGTNISGYYVRDLLTYTKVSGGRKSQSAQAKVDFGCVTHYDGQRALGNRYMSLSVEGLLGLGSSNVSIISQLASSGIVRKEFAHCLVPGEGGGIFAIGHVVKPEVKMIPLHPQTGSLYAASMKSVEVNGKFADLEATAVDNFTIIDSGASLILLPEALFNFVIKEMFSNKSNLNVYGINDFTCFNHSGSLDMTGFPTISFHFFDRDASKVHPVPLRVSPRDYLLQADDHIWCVAIRNGVSGQTILGDTALSNKLVVYDVENKEIGWTEYDCSSSIELEDGNGEVCAVGAQSESPLF